jgi:hypothetical protein
MRAGRLCRSRAGCPHRPAASLTPAALRPADRSSWSRTGPGACTARKTSGGPGRAGALACRTRAVFLFVEFRAGVPIERRTVILRNSPSLAAGFRADMSLPSESFVHQGDRYAPSCAPERWTSESPIFSCFDGRHGGILTVAAICRGRSAPGSDGGDFGSSAIGISPHIRFAVFTDTRTRSPLPGLVCVSERTIANVGWVWFDALPARWGWWARRR